MEELLKGFRRCANKTFWTETQKFLLSGDGWEETGQALGARRRAEVESLFESVRSARYFPDLPYKYFTLPKHRSGVVRVCPVFRWSDTLVYNYCTTYLAPVLVKQRVSGTFGGYRNFTDFLRAEDVELQEHAVPTYGMPSGSFNRQSWVEDWKEYQKILHAYSSLGEFHSFIQFDIANFYSSINLNRLETRLRESILSAGEGVRSEHDATVLNLLFLFLRNWNRSFENYQAASVGIPMDQAGDQSRALANFYLQPYDKWMTECCEAKGCRFLRYSDDQYILGPSKDRCEEVLFEASRRLFSIGLSINAHKVQSFTSATLKQHWLFDLHTELSGAGDGITRAELSSIAKRMLDAKQLHGNNCRWAGVLRRIVRIGVNTLAPQHRRQIITAIYAGGTEIMGDAGYLRSLWSNFNTTERDELADWLVGIVSTERFTGPLYQALWFSQRLKPSDAKLHHLPDSKYISTRIDELSSAFNLR